MSRKEELKAAYKQNWQRLRTMGVFQIRNRENGKVFLDASLNLEGTMERDKKWLSMGGHQNHLLQKEWNEYGEDAFSIEILEVLTPTDDPRNYAEESRILLAAWKEKLEPYGEKGYLPVPRR